MGGRIWKAVEASPCRADAFADCRCGEWVTVFGNNSPLIPTKLLWKSSRNPAEIRLRQKK
jgi:hypothetical protein